MKTFSCKDAGKSCDWTTTGQSDEEILGKVEQHAKEFHKDVSWTDEMKQQVKSLIKPMGEGKTAAA